MKQNLKRNINLGFRVNKEEQEVIRQRQEEAGIRNLRQFLLRMALIGSINKVDLTEINECTRLLRHVSNNINQITKQVNSSGYAHPEELQHIQAQLQAVWEQQDKILRSLARMLEAT